MFNLEAVSCQKKILKMFYLRMDGWMDGMDGMVGKLFFLSLNLVNYLIFFKSVSYPFRMCFEVFIAKN